MTKIRGPLLSLIASGRFASNVVFRNTPHGPVATRFHFPGSANTVTPSAAQLANRAIYGSLVAAWRALTQPQRDQYNADASPLRISGWNLYLRLNFAVVADIERVGVVDAVGLASSPGTLVFTRPVTSGENDHAVICCNWHDSSPGIPAGFAHVAGSPFTMSDNTIVCISKIMGPGEPATWSLTGGTEGRAGALIVHRNVDTTTPIEAADGQINSSSANVTAPSIITLSDGALLLGVFGSEGTFVGEYTYTPPASMFEEADINASDGGSTGIELCSESFPTPGATGTRVAVCTQSSQNTGILLALKRA